MSQEPTIPEPTILEPHPVQAEYIFPKELYIKANVVPSNTTQYEGIEPILQLGYGEYDQEKKIIHISILLEMGKDDKEGSVPFHLRVELLGEFAVDEDKLSPDVLKQWARLNAIYIFHPYLREHVFALTARCGFLPILLPLITVQTFPISFKQSAQD